MKLDKETRLAIEAAIRQAEANTACEFLTVIAERAGPGRFLALILAAAGAFLAGLAAFLFLPWVTTGDLLLIELAAFPILSLVFLHGGIADRLVPGRWRQQAAHRLALAVFLEYGLDATADRTGILLFVAKAERQVEIVADRGLHERVGDAGWAAIVAGFTAAAGKGDWRRAFLEAITALDRHMAGHFPVKPGDRNEIQDRLIEIG